MPSERTDLQLGGVTDGWFFPGYSRQVVAVGASSQDFGPLIGIADPNGTILGADQAAVGQLASVATFTDVRGNYEVPVLASDSSASKLGNYNIVLVCGSYPCQKDDASLCLGGGRYRVQVGWMNQFSNHYGFGRAIPSSDQAGFFSFDDPANIELLIKVLDFGDSVKIFYGELTNLHFMVTVTDLLTDKSKTYVNTSGDCGAIDQDAFPTKRALQGEAKVAKVGACRASSDTLCLLKGRFALKVTWKNQFDGSSGTGTPKPLSDLTGAFSFTDRSNLEILFKILDFGDRIAVFYGTLSNLEYTASVTDTTTGVVKTYHNPANNYCGGLDNTAFPE